MCVCACTHAGETDKFHWHGRMGYVHIDDVALCHILVYENETAHGRYLCSSTVLDNDELASLLAERYPSLPIPKRYVGILINNKHTRIYIYTQMLIVGLFRFEPLNRPCYEFNTSKFKSLGFKFKSIQEMFDDCIASLVEQGHLRSV